MPNYGKPKGNQQKTEKPKRQVREVPPGALGTGMAERAAQAKRRRKRLLDQY